MVAWIKDFSDTYHSSTGVYVFPSFVLIIPGAMIHLSFTKEQLTPAILLSSQTWMSRRNSSTSCSMFAKRFFAWSSDSRETTRAGKVFRGV